ncbi:MAG: hypothetical protein K8H89_14695 [Flavobacteriales bacterium]|nr:hypothetical protein [Flavobacteriales bacterium]
MRTSQLLCLASCVVLISSCSESKLKKEASATALQFFQAIRNSDEAKAAVLYPKFSNLTTYYKSDSALVKGVVHLDSLFIVTVDNHFTNGFGKKTEKAIYLLLKTNEDESMSIVNSSGLTDFASDDDYKVGLGTGCIAKEDTLDQSVLFGMAKASTIKVDQAAELLNKLHDGCTVSGWSWESGYAGSASGKGIVQNQSGFSIPRLKYKVIYKDRIGNEITSDDGYISYDPIENGSSKSFTFYTSYVGDASKASIVLDFDPDLVLDFVGQRADWTGNECAEYFDKHPEELQAIEAKMH